MSARRKSLLALLVVPIVLMLSLVAVGVANATRSPAADHHQALATPTITISMFAFSTPTRARAGATVKVVNKDAVAHTVTSDTAGLFDVSVPAKSTVKFHAPATPGKYKYHCTIHSTMHGVLKVH
jgi:plastocyanin